MKHPYCKNCSNPIRKKTEKIYAPRQYNTALSSTMMHPIKGWEYRGNQIIVSRQYTPLVKDNGKNRLDAVSVWDGESYEPQYKYFCTIRCAAEFGQRAVK